MNYKLKQSTVEAVQWNGENYEECKEIIGDNYSKTLSYPHVIVDGFPKYVFKGNWIVKSDENNYNVYSDEKFKELYNEDKQCKSCACTIKTDLEKFKELYEGIGIELRIDKLEDGTTAVAIKNGAYGIENFKIRNQNGKTFSAMHFDKSGKLIFQGFFIV